jgi:hypothetical protein
MRNEEEEPHKTQAQLPGGETLQQQNASSEQLNLHVNRRNMLKRAGIVLGASGALAALATPAGATKDKDEDTDKDTDEVAGLWSTVVSAPDNSFPPFKAFEVYGAGTWTGSGQTDLTPAALASTAWGTWKRVGHRKFRVIGRYWTYDPNENPTGFGAVDFTLTLSKDGKTYHGEGPTQFFDNNGKSLGPPSTTFDDGTRITFL